jgi:hypothetical protein
VTVIHDLENEAANPIAGVFGSLRMADRVPVRVYWVAKFWRR